MAEDEADPRQRTDGDRSDVIEAYYEGEVTLDEVADEHGEKTAIRVFLLNRSLDRNPPSPTDVEILDPEEFYDGDVREYIPDGK